VDLLNAGFVERILLALREADFPPDCLVLEITEGVVLQDIAAAEAVMHRLRNAGVHFALDDFGSGYSNLAYLHRLPISLLKLDRSLVNDLENTRSAQAIVQHLVALCHDLGIRAVCEGVERESQAVFLSNAVCDEVQGFLYSRPAPSEEIDTMLRSAA
jgi:EAL domain-containing protein (putative c-di-GMP-specific phosphodiesterase class I)